MFVYPVDKNDKHRWIGGLIRCPKVGRVNLHNHFVHSPSTITQCIRQGISKAVSINPTLQTSDITCCNGQGYMPSAVDVASYHLEKIAREVKKAKEIIGMNSKYWSPSEF